jgi:hypothetical protein
VEHVLFSRDPWSERADELLRLVQRFLSTSRAHGLGVPIAARIDIAVDFNWEQEAEEKTEPPNLDEEGWL